MPCRSTLPGAFRWARSGWRREQDQEVGRQPGSKRGSRGSRQGRKAVAMAERQLAERAVRGPAASAARRAAGERLWGGQVGRIRRHCLHPCFLMSQIVELAVL